MTPDVSIITPVYNRQDLLKATINSCLHESCSIEIIVVDDGSDTDIKNYLSAEFPSLTENETSFPRLTVLRQDNQGANVARNLGMSVASGKYIKFLDSDDELVHGALSQEVEAAESSECDVLLTYYYSRKYANGSSTGEYTDTLVKPPLFESGIDDMITGDGPITSAALYRFDVIRHLRWNPDTPKLQDWEWAMTVAMEAPTYKWLNIPSYYYKDHTGPRITLEMQAGELVSRIRPKILERVEQTLKEKGQLNDARKKLLAEHYFTDRQLIVRHHPQNWKATWEHCRELAPTFRSTRANAIEKLLFRLVGTYRGVILYVYLKRLFRF